MKKILFLLFYLSSIVYSQHLKDVTLQLKWKYQFQFAGYIVAKEKGFYKDIGLNVSLKEYENTINIVDEVISNNAQYRITAPTSMIDITKGKKLVYLATIFQSTPLVLLTNKNSGIQSIKDFKNKKMMSTGDNNTDLSLVAMMFSQGVSMKDMQIQRPSFKPRDILDGKTDLMASYITNEPFVLKELGGEPVIFSPKDYGFDFYGDMIIVNQTYLNENLEEVKKFKSVTLKAWEYAFNNIDEVVDIIYNKYNTQKKSKEALRYEAKELAKLAYYQTHEIGKIEALKLEKIYDIYKLLGLVKNNIEFNKIIFNESFFDLELTQKEKNYLEEKGSISMCIDPSWMPFEMFDSKNTHIGMSADYFKLFEKTLQIKFNVVYTSSWSQTLEYAEKRKCDILSLVMKTPKRKKHFNFTSPYLKVPLVFATRIDNPFVNDINNLVGKKLAVPKGYAYGELLQNKYPFLNISDVKNEKEGLELVNQNKFDVYIGTSATIGYILQNEYIGELKIAGKFDENCSLRIGVRNDDIVLLQILQKAINNLKSEDKRAILNKWIFIKYEQGFNYELLFQIFLGMLVIVFFFVYKQYLLRKSIKEFGQLIDSTMEAIFLSKDELCIDVNQSAVELFGYSSKSEIVGKNILEFVADSSQKTVKDKLKEIDSKPYETNLRRKDGTTFPALVKGRLLYSRKLRVSSAIDLTQVKQLEAQAKLASMGEMIGNISHQWRQPLSVISTAVTGIKAQKEYGKEISDEELLNFCEYINENTQYLSQTIDDFRNFIKGDSELIVFNLKKNIDSFINIIDPTIKANHIKLIVNIDEYIELNSYPNELIQCFINIFNNSKDAFILHKIPEEQRLIFIDQIIENNQVIISFLDSAGGIPQEIIKRVFEPYFTTKHKSQGTGLGLHMSYNLIVNSMKGDIKAINHSYTYENKTYQGAKLIIELPLNRIKK